MGLVSTPSTMFVWYSMEILKINFALIPNMDGPIKVDGNCYFLFSRIKLILTLPSPEFLEI